MTSLIVAVLAALAPFVAVLAFLWLAGRVQRERNRARDRQIGLTDAIHLELGAVVAPTVERRPGGWRVVVAAPLDRPVMVADVVAVTRRFFARQDDAGTMALEILLRDRRAARPRAIAERTFGQATETDLPVAA